METLIIESSSDSSALVALCKYMVGQKQWKTTKQPLEQSLENH